MKKFLFFIIFLTVNLKGEGYDTKGWIYLSLLDGGSGFPFISFTISILGGFEGII